ncbi:hypothetical protein LRP52_02075 [Photobacterium sp. ZSDE20]|nr:hypothetical protein [Photobacterium sp. ZSDE20]
MNNCNVHKTHFHKRPVSLVALMMITSFSISAESFLMGFDEYMDRCMSSYGTDKITRSVCEKQYQAIEQKELEIFAKTSDAKSDVWREEEKNADSLNEANE